MYKFEVINAYTNERINIIKIKEEIENKDEIVKKFNKKYFLYSPSQDKYFKGTTEDGCPTFSKKIELSELFDDYTSPFVKRAKLLEYCENNKQKTYVNRIVNKLENCLIYRIDF